MGVPEQIDAATRAARLELDQAVPAFDASGRRLHQFDERGWVIPAPASNCQMCPGESPHVHYWTVVCPYCRVQEVVKGPGTYRYPAHERLVGGRGPCPGGGHVVAATLEAAHLLGEPTKP